MSVGSSPRLRGTLNTKQDCTILTRIIPALAGNTAHSLGLRQDVWDHPRACGEHYVPSCMASYRSGSSPRLRGTRRSVTPSTWSPGDHPRACGEHSCTCNRFGQNMGSSPRLRGTRNCMDIVLVHVGIIPALAGNTGEAHAISRFAGDHPRACGEHSPH